MISEYRGQWPCPTCGNPGGVLDHAGRSNAPAERPDAWPVVLTAHGAEELLRILSPESDDLKLVRALRALASGQTVCVPAGGDDARDAARYRWLRSDESTFAVFMPRKYGHIAFLEEGLDSHIDEAMDAVNIPTPEKQE